MKRYMSRWILCAACLSVLIVVSMVFAEMKRVDDKELAQTNAPVTKAKFRKGISPVKAAFDDTSMMSSRQVITAGEGFSLNLTTSPETWTYNFSTFNSNYWGGNVTGVKTSR